LGVGGGDKEANQTRDYCAAKNRSAGSGQAASRRAARLDSLGKLGTGSLLRKERLLRMKIVRFGQQNSAQLNIMEHSASSDGDIRRGSDGN
jgi:hypothetical protein